MPLPQPTPLHDDAAPWTDRHPLSWVCHRFGPAAEVLTAQRAPLARPGPRQVAVDLIAASINPSDLISLSGAYASRLPLPMVAGYESVARVTALGPDVTGLTVGQRVLPLGGPGAWVEARVLDADWCLPVDPRLNDAQAATAYVNPLTAWLMLTEVAQITPLTRLAVSAAGSVIGRMILRLATRLGLRPVAVLRSPASRARLSGLVLESVIAGADPRAALAQAWGGQGPDLVLDCVGGSVGQALMGALVPGGQLIHYGLLSGQPLGRDAPLRRDIRFGLFVLRDWVHGHDRADLAQLLARTAPLILDGTLASPIAARFALDDLPAALAMLEAPGRDGKVLLMPGTSCR